MTTPNATSASAITDSIHGLGGNLTAFAQYGGSSFWTGAVEQAAILQAALTQSERAYIYNGGAGIPFTQLKAEAGH